MPQGYYQAFVNKKRKAANYSEFSFLQNISLSYNLSTTLIADYYCILISSKIVVAEVAGTRSLS